MNVPSQICVFNTFIALFEFSKNPIDLHKNKHTHIYICIKN